jgi:hypothetical protein
MTKWSLEMSPAARNDFTGAWFFPSGRPFCALSTSALADANAGENGESAAGIDDGSAGCGRGLPAILRVWDKTPVLGAFASLLPTAVVLTGSMVIPLW